MYLSTVLIHTVLAFSFVIYSLSLENRLHEGHLGSPGIPGWHGPETELYRHLVLLIAGTLEEHRHHCSSASFFPAPVCWRKAFLGLLLVFQVSLRLATTCILLHNFPSSTSIRQRELQRWQYD